MCIFPLTLSFRYLTLPVLRSPRILWTIDSPSLQSPQPWSRRSDNTVSFQRRNTEPRFNLSSDRLAFKIPYKLRWAFFAMWSWACDMRYSSNTRAGLRLRGDVQDLLSGVFFFLSATSRRCRGPVCMTSLRPEILSVARPTLFL